MSNLYYKIANYLDNIGKYKQADKVDFFIKTSQSISTLKSTDDPLLREMQDIFGGEYEFRKTTTGPASELTDQPGRSLADVTELNQLTPMEVYNLSLTEGGAEIIRNRFTELGQILAGYSQTANATTLTNLLTMIQNELINPLVKANRSDVVDQNLRSNIVLTQNISSAIKNMILVENNISNIAQTITNIENQFGKYSVFVALTQGSILYDGISDAYDTLRSSDSPDQQSKALELKKNPTTTKYIPK